MTFSRGCPWEADSGRPWNFRLGRCRDVRLRRPQDVRSGRPRDDQIGFSGNFPEKLEGDQYLQAGTLLQSDTGPSTWCLITGLDR